MKGKRTTCEVITRDGKKTVEGWSYNDALVVHKAFGYDSPSWTVTHRPSGKAVFRAPTRNLARWATLRLWELTNAWPSAEENINQNFLRPFAVKLNELVQRYEHNYLSLDAAAQEWREEIKRTADPVKETAVPRTTPTP